MSGTCCALKVKIPITIGTYSLASEHFHTPAPDSQRNTTVYTVNGKFSLLSFFNNSITTFYNSANGLCNIKPEDMGDLNLEEKEKE